MKSVRRVTDRLGVAVISARALASEFRLAPPTSLLAILRRLELKLDPETIVRNSGELGPSTTSGWAQLLFNSAGFWCYRGHMHESGFIGHHYAFTAVIDFKDAFGRVIAFVQQGEIDGTVDPFGSRDSDWQQNGHDPFFSDNWDSLKHCKAKFELRVTTDPSEAIVAIAGIGLVTAAAGVGFVVFASDPNVKCEARGNVDVSATASDVDVDAGADLSCRKEFK